MAKKRANGEGNIRKRKDGRWEGRYTAGVDPETGKPIAKSVLARTQRECKEKLQKAMEELEKIDITNQNRITTKTKTTTSPKTLTLMQEKASSR